MQMAVKTFLKVNVFKVIILPKFPNFICEGVFLETIFFSIKIGRPKLSYFTSCATYVIAFAGHNISLGWPQVPQPCPKERNKSYFLDCLQSLYLNSLSQQHQLLGVSHVYIFYR